jgi:hypothetical protein
LAKIEKIIGPVNPMPLIPLVVADAEAIALELFAVATAVVMGV